MCWSTGVINRCADHPTSYYLDKENYHWNSYKKRFVQFPHAKWKSRLIWDLNRQTKGMKLFEKLFISRRFKPSALNAFIWSGMDEGTSTIFIGLLRSSDIQLHYHITQRFNLRFHWLCHWPNLIDFQQEAIACFHFHSCLDPIWIIPQFIQIFIQFMTTWC